MTVIFGALLGFASSLVPEISKNLLDKSDKKHELAMYELQLKAAEVKREVDREVHFIGQETSRLEHIYKPSGVHWIEAVNGLVRPFVTISLITLYVYVRIMSYPEDVSVPFWTDEDSTLLTAVVTYYFGQRTSVKA